MAQFDVEKIYGATYLKDGKIDFDILGDIDGRGFTRFVYTWSPDDNAPMAAQLAALYMSNPKMKIAPYVWTRPERIDLVRKLKQVLKKLRVSDYAERAVSTFGVEPFPEDVAEKAAYAREVYNNFKDNPELIPEDWEDNKYWYKEE